MFNLKKRASIFLPVIFLSPLSVLFMPLDSHGFAPGCQTSQNKDCYQSGMKQSVILLKNIKDNTHVSSHLEGGLEGKGLVWKIAQGGKSEIKSQNKNQISIPENSMDKYKEIYLAGGCFWGVEKYFASIKGVIQTDVGYANGKTSNPSYEDVIYRGTNHAETVHIVYDPQIISLPFILEMYYKIIDPTSINKQGNDVGTQYRTGIYYTNGADESIARASLDKLAQNLQGQKIAIELQPLANYYRAEEYHQKYLEKNPNGYCHIGEEKFAQARKAFDTSLQPSPPQTYRAPSRQELRERLNDLQYHVTCENGTEEAFNNEYWDNHREGIYVDITTGEPLFSSKDKFDSGSGWPSFTQPITGTKLQENVDKSFGMIRTEVRSSAGDAHLGHLFNDGPKDRGGLRYCINSASLLFIPKEDMEKKGYGHLLGLFK